MAHSSCEKNDVSTPEIIFIKYEGDDFEQKLANHQVIIQIKGTDGDCTENLIGYKGNPSELLEVAEVEVKEDSEDSAHKNNNEQTIVEYSCPASLEKEIDNAVNSIETSNLCYDTEIVYHENREILMYACEPINDEEINKFPCKTCGLVVGCIFCLKTHFQSVHHNFGIIQHYLCKQNFNIQINQADVCPKCKLICPGKEDMMEHRKIHFASCLMCNATFDNPLFLANHCKERHEDFQVTVECEICDNAFTQLIELSEHYQSCHNMIMCIVCLERFVSKSELELHHKKHAIVLTAESPLPFACSRCNMAFSTISDLSRHLNSEHSNKKRKADSQVDVKFVPVKK